MPDQKKKIQESIKNKLNLIPEVIEFLIETAKKLLCASNYLSVCSISSTVCFLMIFFNPAKKYMKK